MLAVVFAHVVASQILQVSTSYLDSSCSNSYAATAVAGYDQYCAPGGYLDQLKNSCIQNGSPNATLGFAKIKCVDRPTFDTMQLFEGAPLYRTEQFNSSNCGSEYLYSVNYKLDVCFPTSSQNGTVYAKYSGVKGGSVVNISYYSDSSCLMLSQVSQQTPLFKDCFSAGPYSVKSDLVYPQISVGVASSMVNGPLIVLVFAGLMM